MSGDPENRNPAEPAPAVDESNLSKVEHLKAASNYLRGSIAEELQNDSPQFEEETVQLLKHHGMYQQDDRDKRNLKGPDGQRLGKQYSMMVRLRIPGGKLTASQFLAQLDLAREFSIGSIRLTDRQAIQFHFIAKRDVRSLVQRIHAVELSTLAACGDVERNILCCPAPLRQTPMRDQMQDLTDRLARHLAPRTPAYHEIWLTDPDTGEKELVGGAGADSVEPIYGKTYLPRKFKTAIALPEDNCVDVYTHDLGFLAIHDGRTIEGFNVLVGGGMGVTPSDKKTFPAIAQAMAFVAPDDVVAVAEAVVKVQRDFGNRSDRKRARMKYLVADWGLPRFRAKVEEYFGRPLADPRPVDATRAEDHLGWHSQGDGRWFYGQFVENGRVRDVAGGPRLFSALEAVCLRIPVNVRLTAQQNLLFTDVAEADRPALDAVLRDHGIPAIEAVGTARRWAMACVSLPTCPLAITESERVMPDVITRLETELAALGLDREAFTLRTTGCPNGCARPYNAEVGLVGKALGKYTVFLGGSPAGNRLAFIYKNLVPLDDLVPTLLPVFRQFRDERLPGESFGDFCHRKGAADLAG